MTRKSLLNSLTEGEWLLLAETKRAAMADLDEDELLALHTRIRRARTKYMSQYRRAASYVASLAEVQPSLGRRISQIGISSCAAGSRGGAPDTIT